MSCAWKPWNGLAGALAAAWLFSATVDAASAQSRGPRDDYDDEAEQTYGPRYRYGSSTGESVRDHRAGKITKLSQARSRGEDVNIYDRAADADFRRFEHRAFGPPREYAEVRDSRYQRDAAEAPNADDQRPLRAARSGHYDPRTGGYDDFGPYADRPLGRSSRGGEDRADAPGYLNHAGREASLSNGYSTRGVQEFSDGRGQGVRLDDLYPLDTSVNPRRYRGHFDQESYDLSRTDADDDRDIETFIRREMSVRPGANLRVSSTGTYDFRHYVDHGNQVNARFRLPVHRRYQYAAP